MLNKYLTYLNTTVLVVLLLLAFTGHSANFGAVPPVNTASQVYDFALDSSNGVGTAAFYVNSTKVIASTTAGVADTWTATSTFKAPVVSTGTTQDTVSVCGTSPSISGANGIGHVTLGSAVSSTCTVTFGTAFNAKPVCSATTEGTSSALALTPAAASLVIGFSSTTVLNSQVVDYVCIGQ